VLFVVLCGVVDSSIHEWVLTRGGGGRCYPARSHKEDLRRIGLLFLLLTALCAGAGYAKRHLLTTWS
jgi:hypothetical protein